MCTFYNALPKQSKSVGIKKRNLGLFLKPCPDDKTYYRFRLLAFTSTTTDRDFPWIQRFMHVKYGTHPEKGYPMVIDSVTCPVTPHVHVEGNRYNACKMCDIANKYFVRFKESNYTDKDAGKKNKELGRKLEYAIPVYVLTDPNYDGNNGKFKVLILNDKKVYEELKSKVEKQTLKNNVFNGQNAVDCCIHVSEISEAKNEGSPNAYVWKHRVIDKIVFSNKPYDIPAITKDAVDAMHFDDEYYTSSTPAEIDAFYKKWCTVSNDDIPDDDDADSVIAATTKNVVVSPETFVNPVTPTPVPETESATDSDITDAESILKDLELPASTETHVEPDVEANAAATDIADDDLNSFLNELDI